MLEAQRAGLESEQGALGDEWGDSFIARDQRMNDVCVPGAAKCCTSSVACTAKIATRIGGNAEPLESGIHLLGAAWRRQLNGASAPID